MGNFLKKSFLAGLLVTLPLALTYLLFSFLMRKLDLLMAPLVREIILETGAPLPEDFHLPGLGFFITCLIMCLIGVFAKNFIGGKIVLSGQNFLQSIPFVKTVYTTIQQVLNSISKVDKRVFEKMVLLRYPHLSTYVVGLVACDAEGEVVMFTGDNSINVFVPMLPNVTLGWLLVVPRDQVTVLKMSREEGIKMLLSFGIFKAGGSSASNGPGGQPTGFKNASSSS